MVDAFDSSTLRYAVAVGQNVEDITLSATTSHAQATMAYKVGSSGQLTDLENGNTNAVSLVAGAVTTISLW
jgi:phage-related tail fiber protein